MFNSSTLVEKERLCLDYIQRIELLALFKQVKLGPYTPEKDTDTGYFDVVGYDRRYYYVYPYQGVMVLLLA